MDSRLRHDLRHPISTISMIASAVVEFSDDMSDELLDGYAAQVHSEYETFVRMVAETGLSIEVGALGDTQAVVGGASDVKLWSLVAEEARNLLDEIDGMGGSAAPTS